MQVLMGRAGSGKTKYFKEHNSGEFEEKIAETEDDLISLLHYSNNDSFREKMIPLLINVWYDFDSRTLRKNGIQFDKYPYVTLECHKLCIPVGIEFHRILGGIEQKESFKLLTNREMFELIGYKTVYWNNDNNKYLQWLFIVDTH